MPLQLSRLLGELFKDGVPLDALDMIEVEHDAGTLDSAVQPCGIVWAEAHAIKLPPKLKQPVMHLSLVAREAKVNQPTTVRACVQAITEALVAYENALHGPTFGWVVVTKNGDIFVRNRDMLAEALVQVQALEIIPVIRQGTAP